MAGARLHDPGAARLWRPATHCDRRLAGMGRSALLAADTAPGRPSAGSATTQHNSAGVRLEQTSSFPARWGTISVLPCPDSRQWRGCTIVSSGTPVLSAYGGPPLADSAECPCHCDEEGYSADHNPPGDCQPGQPMSGPEL